jgi:hypothetical protein
MKLDKLLLMAGLFLAVAVNVVFADEGMDTDPKKADVACLYKQRKQEAAARAAEKPALLVPAAAREAREPSAPASVAL